MGYHKFRNRQGRPNKSPSPSMAQAIEVRATAPNPLPTVRPLNPGRAPGSRRWATALTHIALARKPSLGASGLLLWARATS